MKITRKKKAMAEKSLHGIGRKRGGGIFFGALALVLVLSCSACGGSEKKEVEVWTVPSSMKILSDVEYGEREKAQKTLTINMAKNENESGQIIITPQADVREYDIKINELTNGDSVIPVSDITVLNQKYIEVTQSSKNMETPLGLYPDALLPFDVAKEYGENTVVKGRNQGIWIDVRTTSDTKPGLYSGKFEVILDGEIRNVNVNVNVWDLEISSEVHIRSLFYTKPRFYAMAEKEPTDALMEKYVDKLLDFRLSPLYLPYFGSVDSANANVSEYVDQVRKYTQDKRLTFYQIPYSVLYASNGAKRIDEHSLTEYIVAIAKASMEEGRNMLEKAGLYLSNLIDEPELNGTVSEIAIHSDAIKRCKAAAIELLGSMTDSIMKNEVIASIEKIPHILTNRYIESQKDNVDIWCPTLNKFHTVADREVYAQEEEVWWYGCIDPQAPYATYYIDDLSPSPRIMSWMQKDYNIAGNLYWAVDLYGNRFDSTKKINPYTDEPDRAAWADTNRANGDGFLFYPGSYYGIDGPVASLRLYNIRDGLEDYELLYQIEKLYEENGQNSDDVLDLVYKKLYEGTKVFADSVSLEKARGEIADILLAAKNGVFVGGVDVTRDTATVSVFASETDGVTVNGEYPIGGVVKIPLNREENLLTVRYGENSFQLRICGKTEVLDYSVSDTDNIGVLDGVVSKAEVDGRRVAKIALFDAESNKRQRFSISGSIVEKVDKNCSVTIEMYVNGVGSNSENMRLEVLLEGTKSSIYTNYEVITLKEGKNVIRLDSMFFAQWKSIGKLKAIHFNVGEQGGAARDIYIASITRYVE